MADGRRVIEAGSASLGKLASDPRAAEVLSAWILADGRNTVLVKPDAWEDPFICGMLLADVSRHVANAIVMTKGGEAAELLSRRIRAGFDAEMSHPTDVPAGRLTDAD